MPTSTWAWVLGGTATKQSATTAANAKNLNPFIRIVLAVMYWVDGLAPFRCAIPCHAPLVTFRTDLYDSVGLPTVGFRSARWGIDRTVPAKNRATRVGGGLEF